MRNSSLILFFPLFFLIGCKNELVEKKVNPWSIGAGGGNGAGTSRVEFVFADSKATLQQTGVTAANTISCEGSERVYVRAEVEIPDRDSSNNEIDKIVSDDLVIICSSAVAMEADLRRLLAKTSIEATYQNEYSLLFGDWNNDYYGIYYDADASTYEGGANRRFSATHRWDCRYSYSIDASLGKMLISYDSAEWSNADSVNLSPWQTVPRLTDHHNDCLNLLYGTSANYDSGTSYYQVEVDLNYRDGEVEFLRDDAGTPFNGSFTWQYIPPS